MNFLATLMFVLAAVHSIRAACEYDQPEFGGCSRKPAGITGEKWETDTCMTCYCSKIYTTILECYLPSEDNANSPDIPAYFDVKLEGPVIPASCPFGFREVPETKFSAKLLLNYQVFRGFYEQTCCGKARPASWPSHCEVKQGADGCSFEIVMKADNSKPCDGRIAVSG